MIRIGKRISLVLSILILTFGILFLKLNTDTFIFILVANQIAFLITGFMYDKTKTKAERDPLTNLYNRVFISEKLPKLLKQKKNLSVCIVDIDRFKQINDNFGHLVGDEVIKSIASILQTETRKTDLVVRWGGDEFLIFAPNLNNEILSSLNERINKRLAEISKNYGFSVSISMGFATCSHSSDIETIIQTADENMYLRKREKQNRLHPQFS